MLLITRPAPPMANIVESFIILTLYNGLPGGCGFDQTQSVCPET